MNKLKTKISVACNLQGKVLPTQAIVVGELGTKVIKSLGIEVGFTYRTESGQPVLYGANTYDWGSVNTLWESVKVLVPEDATFEELLGVAFLEAFKIEMADTFNISTNDIEVVSEGV